MPIDLTQWLLFYKMCMKVLRLALFCLYLKDSFDSFVSILLLQILVTDFFGSVRNIELSNSTKLLIHESKHKVENQNKPIPRPLRSLDNFPSKPEVWDFYFGFIRRKY